MFYRDYLQEFRSKNTQESVPIKQMEYDSMQLELGMRLSGSISTIQVQCSEFNFQHLKKKKEANHMILT